MTTIAGIFRRSRSYVLEDSTCEAIKRLVSRNSRDEVTTFRDEHLFLAKIDINAYGQPAFRIAPSGTVSALAGEPLLSPDGSKGPGTRQEDLEILHSHWDRDDWTILERARGNFTSVYYRPESISLNLIADKLGLRSMYYFEGPGYVVFATALRILEGLSEVPKEMDLRGIVELQCFHVPLGGRTTYAGISLLRAGEVLSILEKKINRSRYWSWECLAESTRPEEELLEAAYERFEAAVKGRLRGDGVTFGFLTGGLDSRCIVGVLRKLGADVHTFNFAPPGTQDQVFADAFAEQAGAQHEEIPFSKSLLEPSGLYPMLADVWRESREHLTSAAERPNLAWVGSGGSVGLGYVYMSARLVELLRSNTDAGVDWYVRQGGIVPRRIMKPDLYTQLSDIPYNAVREELANIECEDQGRAFQLFLMLNDQRRSLTTCYEDIDLHRLEFHVPFFDSYFLEVALSLPVELGLGHRFYTKWLDYFPAAVTDVPWQTYPGHVPCPLPVAKELGYQFDRSYSRERDFLVREKRLQQASKMLKSENFPHPILNKGVLRLATWLYRNKLQDYGYVIDAASTYYDYWNKCEGRYLVP